MQTMSNNLFTVYILLCLLATTASGQDKLAITKFTQDITFDGIPDEPAWDLVNPLPVVTQTPEFGAQPTEKTEILIAYNDEYIYVAGRLFDQEPDLIMANSYKRDALIGNTDWFGFTLDSYNDKQNALGFYTNPNGLRLDLNVINDAYGTLPINISWNAVWDVATQTTDEGWFVEMRVPFSSIPFQTIDGSVTMGLIAWRYIARKNEVDIFPAVSPEFGEWSSWKPSQAHEIELRSVVRKKPLYIAPYVIGGLSQESSLSVDHESYIKDSDPSFDAGLDVKYGITNNLNLDLTVNTDFAQVEADDQQINLTRFSLFFPEKRLFFQERAGIFDFDFGRQDKLFYSRRIGIEDDQTVRIYGGARIVGRIGGLDIGALSMQTEATDSVASLNHSVVRLKKQIINKNSDVGLIYTNQTDFDGQFTTNVGLDSRLALTDVILLNLKWAQSLKPELDNKPGNIDASRLYFSLLNQSRVGFLFGTSLSKSGKDFDPSLGFQTREDFWRWGHRVGYGWLPEESWIQQHSISWRGQLYQNNQEGKLESYFGGLSWNFNSRKGTVGEIGIDYRFEQIFESFELGDEIEIQPGTYDFYNLGIEYTSQFGKPFFSIYMLDVGSFYDGSRFSLTYSPNWTASKSLELSGTFIYNYLSFDDIQETLFVTRLKALYMFNTKVSIASFIQFNNDSNTFLANIRFRYNPKEGNDLFIVYNDDLNTDRYLETPHLPFSNLRTLLVKYTHTFRG